MLRLLLSLTTALLLLSGCQPSIPSTPEKFGKEEQLYIDARHGFSINHPQSWRIVTIPVSSPDYREDTVIWEITGSEPQSTFFAITQATISGYSDLEAFNRAMLKATYVNHGIPKANQKIRRPSGKIIHSDLEIIYISLSRPHHYYHLSLSGPKPIAPETADIIDSIAGSLREL